MDEQNKLNVRSGKKPWAGVEDYNRQKMLEDIYDKNPHAFDRTNLIFRDELVAIGDHAELARIEDADAVNDLIKKKEVTANDNGRVERDIC